MNTSPLVSIVLINWNGKADTCACLDSLRQDRYANKKIIVVDNGSSDDSADFLEANYPEIILLRTGANLGFAGGNNVGIQHAIGLSSDYIYLLNNDTTSEPDALQELVAHAVENVHCGILSPVIHCYYEPDSVWFGGSNWCLRRGKATHDNSRPLSRESEPFETPWVSGCAMLARADLLKQLGGFDERYFLVWEDVDLCARTRKAGYAVGLVPAARIYHKVGRSFARGTSFSGAYYGCRNKLLFIRCHAGSYALSATLLFLTEEAYTLTRSLIKDRAFPTYDFRVLWRSMQDHLRNEYGQFRPGTPAKTPVSPRVPVPAESSTTVST